MSDHRPKTTRRRPGLLTSAAAVAATSVGGLFLVGAVPAPMVLVERVPGAATVQMAGDTLQERVGDDARRQTVVADVALTPPAGADGADDEPRRSDPVEIASVLEDAAVEVGLALVPAPTYETSDGETIDPERIRAWLEDRNSPMAPYAEELVAAGIEHDVDPRLVVGIAAIESSAGKRLPPGSHNAWGWNGNGPHGLKAWPSWPVAIDEFTEGLARVYDTDNVDERMARKYVPPNWQKWLRTVRWVIDDI